MDLFNFIIWLTTGAVIGWFARGMIVGQNERRAHRQIHSEECSDETG